MPIFEELKRRNVFRVALFYVVASWLILQVADLLFEALGLPDIGVRIVLALLIVGFPFALIVAWVYELTPEGLKRESQVDRAQSITAVTGRRLDLATIALVGVGVAFLLADRFIFANRPLPAQKPAATATQTDTPVIAVLPFKATGSEDGGFLATG